MSASTTRLPEGRYGRSSDERADHKVRIAAVVLGALLVAMMGYFAWHYVVKNEISAEVITFEPQQDAVQVHLEVRKDAAPAATARSAPRRRTAPRSAGPTSASPGTPPASTRSSRSVRRRRAPPPSSWAVTPTEFICITYWLTCVDVNLVGYVLPLGR